MKFREFSYKIRDDIIPRNNVVRVSADGVVCTIEFVKFIPERRDMPYYRCSVTVPADEVEVIIDAK